jgi:hypothetical protein
MLWPRGLGDRLEHRQVTGAADAVSSDLLGTGRIAVYLTRRWRFRGIDSDRLRAFAKNCDHDVEDYLDLAACRTGGCFLCASNSAAD